MAIPIPAAEQLTDEKTFEDTPILIAVVGATGSGKSTFINLVSGADQKVSTAAKLAGPSPCTKTVDVAPDFKLDGYTVRLVDTPGFVHTGFVDTPRVASTPGFVDTPWFDDTGRNDVEVFRTVAQFLNAQYSHSNRKFHGIIYLQRVSDTIRMRNSAGRAFRQFWEMCGGGDTLKNVVIATTMWANVTPAEGERREQEIRLDKRFFMRALDNQATLMRHDDTENSAREILRAVLQNQWEFPSNQGEVIDGVKGKHHGHFRGPPPGDADEEMFKAAGGLPTRRRRPVDWDWRKGISTDNNGDQHISTSEKTTFWKPNLELENDEDLPEKDSPTTDASPAPAQESHYYISELATHDAEKNACCCQCVIQ